VSAPATSSRTRTAAPLAPAGYWLQHTRYRNYVLFDASALLRWLGVIVLLEGLFALAGGVATWEAYLAVLRSPLGVALSVVVLAATLFFSLRWLRVGVKVATVDIGPVPAMPGPVVLVAHYAGLLALTGLVLLIAAGVIL
jgi:fumarate reductase subunit C